MSTLSPSTNSNRHDEPDKFDSNMNLAGSRWNWVAAQRSYWDTLATHYDQLYCDRWSMLENVEVRNYLARILSPECSVLDLGCGTGLAYEIISTMIEPHRYFGIDISPRMIDLAKKKHPHGSFMVGNMSSLSALRPRRFDAIVALSSSLSYSCSPSVTLRDAFTLLNPSGSLLVSMLGRWSVRRLIQAKLGSIERYGTRGASTNSAPGAWVFGPVQARRLVEAAGFVRCSTWAQGALSGVLQAPCLWHASRTMAQVFPLLGHTLYVQASRPELSDA